MPTPFEQLQRALAAQLKTASTVLSDDEKIEVILRAVRDYSVADPLLKSAALTLAENKLTLPTDFLAVEEVLAADGSVLDPQRLVLDWANAVALTAGHWTQQGRKFLKFPADSTGTVTLWYWGFHAEDGATLTPRDVVRVTPLVLAYGCASVASLKAQSGRVQAGPVSFDHGAVAAVFSAQAQLYQQEYDRTVKRRPYGTRGLGRDFNTREASHSTSGETLL